MIREGPVCNSFAVLGDLNGGDRDSDVDSVCDCVEHGVADMLDEVRSDREFVCGRAEKRQRQNSGGQTNGELVDDLEAFEKLSSDEKLTAILLKMTRTQHRIDTICDLDIPQRMTTTESKLGYFEERLKVLEYRL